jgi:hypothetical protein
MIESLQEKDEEERKQDRLVYEEGEQEDSLHRRFLRAKIDILKRMLFECHDQIAQGKNRPDLPVDAYSMDIDVFLLWCLQSPEYRRCRKVDRYLAGGILGIYESLGRFYIDGRELEYEQEAGCMIATFRAREEEERRWLSMQHRGVLF